jgi:hypothetical protein
MKRWCALLSVSVFSVLFLGGCCTKRNAVSETESVTTLNPGGILPVVPEGVETRWASRENPKGEKGVAAQANAGRKGAPAFRLAAGASETLAEVTGTSGTIRRIWITIRDRNPKMLRGIRLDFYWDGAATPAVSVPIGDFFGHGLGRMAAFENALFSSPEARSFNCFIPMPFKTGMKVLVTNETDQDQSMFFYDIDYTIGDPHPENALYFHAHFRRQNPTTLKEDFEILPLVQGRGRYLGALVSVIPDQEKYFRSWWGEGEVKVYLDGDDQFPTLSGTGTEDYIGTGWGQGQYADMYQGCPIADHENFRYSFYRLHVPDPVYFHDNVRVTIQQIGYGNAGVRKQLHEAGNPVYRAGPGLKEIDLAKEGGLGLFEREDDWSACSYFYLDRPENNLTPLQPLEERLAGLE